MYKRQLSRSRIFELKPLGTDDIKDLLNRAVTDKEKGFGDYHVVMDKEAIDFLAEIAGGDARAALNALEIGVLTTDRCDDGTIHITLEISKECIQKRVANYDKDGDDHYNTISAFIKSMRGSDPDAAVYYLAKMLHAGEDVKFIARRIMICASEDVGNADPMALVIATNASLAVERIGMPEARIILSQAVLYIATAPKSNSAINAIDSALQVAASGKNYPIPGHLKDAHYNGASALGSGIGYKYPHDYKNNYVEQQYLPDILNGMRFYESCNNGYENVINEYVNKIKNKS